MNLQAESVAHPVPAVKATAPGWLWPSAVALAPAAFFSESFLSPVPQSMVSQPREHPRSGTVLLAGLSKPTAGGGVDASHV